MAYFKRDGVQLHYIDEGQEASGSSDSALLFLHEFGGDARTWKQQLSHFKANRRCLVLSARGYPPSDVPTQAQDYGWQINLDDALGLAAHLGIKKLDVVGLSMGAYIALMLVLQAPHLIRSAVCASVGSGGLEPSRQAFIDDALASAAYIRQNQTVPAEAMAKAPNRIQLRAKNEHAWLEFRDHLAEHPAVGAAHTLAEVQAKRPGLTGFAEPLQNCKVPVLILVGDEDEPCLDASLWLKRQMPLSGLTMTCRSGHLLNLEDPELFNQMISDFHQALGNNQWPVRAQTPFTSMFEPVEED